ncbi:Hsp20/alpha crystallin family protein [bacterium]|nr:Hsp20/alpha crystallin family protein [bacterium]
MHKLFDELTGDDREEGIGRSVWMPRVNINETKDEFVVTVDLPGMKKEDISINLENNMLTITGERKFEVDEKKDNFHRIEKQYGKFSRAFRLPNNVDEKNVEAEYKNGELHVTLKKREEKKPKEIPIKVK